VDDQAQLIDIGGRRLFAQVQGSGPGVVLMSGACAAGVGGWDSADSHLAQVATVVTYDRAGTGRSDPPLSAPSATDMVQDLHLLLLALRLTLPVVLVGRSLGALPAQLYACEYPAEVKGVVLLDPTPDLMLTNYYAPAPKASHRSDTSSGHLERQRIAESCAQVRRAIEEEGRMPNVPVVVVTAADRSDMGTERVIGDPLLLAYQHMVARVPQGRLVVAERSSHKTLISSDCDLIISTVRSIISH